MKKRMTAASMAALMAVSMLPVSACAASAEDMAPVKAPAWNTAQHMQYMNGYADGTFRPDASITRAEACKLIAGLLAEKSGGGDYTFIDVPADAWFAESVSEMTGFSLINGYENGTFRPDAPITRAEFVSILARFPHTDRGTEQSFADVPASHWAHEAVQTALAQGWVTSDARFRPDAKITRAETVTMINRVLGRQGDPVTAASGEGVRIMPDVPDTHWAYLDMLEATTDHKHEMREGLEVWTGYDRETTDLAAGWHNINGLLFHVNEEKLFDRSTKLGGLELDHNGRYTTGSAELDQLLTGAVKGIVNSKMTQQEKLRAVYDYAKKAFGYLGIGSVDTSKEGWEIEQATNMLKNKKGNCYSWASAFTYLARQVGYDAKAIAGKGVSPKGSESVHAWTEITIDGTAYTFDPQIESVYASRYGEKYDLFMKKYGEAVWGYKKDETKPEQPETPVTPEVDAKLAALMEKVYGDKPYASMIQQTALSNTMGADGMTQGIQWFLGTDKLNFTAGLASESAMTAQAHSVILLRFADAKEAEAAVPVLKESVDPRKWICVGVEKAVVECNGDLVCIVMDDENGATYLKNFREIAVAE